MRGGQLSPRNLPCAWQIEVGRDLSCFLAPFRADKRKPDDPQLLTKSSKSSLTGKMVDIGQSCLGVKEKENIRWSLWSLTETADD